MQLNNLKSSKGATKSKKRVGRGIAGGGGKTCGKGMKGQNSRQGKGKTTRGFSGGQVPLFRRMPRLRGFNAINRTEYQAVNVSALNIFKEGEKVDKAALVGRNLVAKMNLPVKLLGMGELTVKKLQISLEAASASAIAKVEKAGGKVEVAAKKEATTKEEVKTEK